MPKRDAAYMERQRERIARAALEVFLEKGLYEASMRDICAAAGVSTGGLYNLFPTRSDVVIAARYYDLIDSALLPPADDWTGYVAALAAAYCSRDKKDVQRRRLSLQFAAEVSQMERNPEGLPVLYDLQRRQLKANLQAVAERGQVSLPYGLERTVEVHAQIALGANFRLSNDLDLSVEEAVAIMADGLAATAGYTGART